MARVVIEIDQVKLARLYALLDGLVDLPAVLEPASAEVRERWLARARHYPPPLPRQRYVRTYKLRGGWTSAGGGFVSRLLGSKTLVHVQNAVSYAPYVQLRERQAAIHRGRWTTTADIVESEASWALGRYNLALGRYIARHA